MKVKDIDKRTNNKEVRCECNRYLLTIRDKEIFIRCRRCKREHKLITK